MRAPATVDLGVRAALRADARRTVALAVLAFLLVAGFIAARTARNAVVPGKPFLDNPGLHDFRDVLYYPARAVLDGRNPYDATTFLASYPVARPFAPYAPTTLLLHLPFAMLPFTVAAWTHFAVNTLLVLAIAVVCLHACGLRATVAATFAFGTAILLSRPAHMTLHIGQCTMYIALATFLALCYGRSRPWLAGVGLAVACVKPTFGIPLGLVMLVRRDVRAIAWAAVFGGVAMASIVVVLAAAAGGVGPLLASFRDSYARLLEDPSVAATSSIIRLDAIALVTRLAGDAVGRAGEQMITLVLLASGVAAIALVERSRLDERRLLSSTIAILTLLTCMYHQAYDALLLALPALALAIGDPALTTAFGRARWLLLALLCVPAFNYAATSTFVEGLGVEGGLWRLVTSVNGAVLLAALVVSIAATLRLAVGTPAIVTPLRSGGASL